MLLKFYKISTRLTKNVQRHTSKQTMFSGVLKTSKRLCTNSLQNSVPQERSFAAIAGKSKFPKTFLEQQTKKDIQTEYNAHAQYITDFNIIYENPKDIRLYAIASLHTNPMRSSTNVCKDQNYKFENKPQQIKFFQTPLIVSENIHIVKNSKKYFDNNSIKEKIEKTYEYKNIFNHVLEELQTKAIKFKMAETPEQHEQTGFNILIKTNYPQDTNALLEILPVKNV